MPSPLASSTITLCGMSAAVSTARTPGTARASAVSMPMIRGARQLRADDHAVQHPRASPSRRRSAACPATFSTKSRCGLRAAGACAARARGGVRVGRQPTTAGLLGAPVAVGLDARRGSSCSPCSGRGCRPAPRAAPRGRPSGCRSRYHFAVSEHPGRAEPALRAGVLEEALLQRVELARRAARPAHRRDLGAVGLHGEHQARVDRLAVEQDRAGAADALAAAELDLGGRALVAQQLEQRQVRRRPTPR